MGRDTPSNAELAHKTDDYLKEFLGWMIPEKKYKWLIIKYSTYIQEYRDVIHHSTCFLPIISALIIILVQRDIAHAAEMTEVHKRWTKAEKEIAELRREIKDLKKLKSAE